MVTYPPPAPPAPPAPVPPPAFPTLRQSDQIQGNILAGFRKDRQELLFVSFAGQNAARAWPAKFCPGSRRRRRWRRSTTPSALHVQLAAAIRTLSKRSGSTSA